MEHDQPIVAALCPLKQQGPPVFAGKFKGEPDSKTGLQEAYSVGAGFLCVRREVFLELIKASAAPYHRHPMYPQGGLQYDFWHCGAHGDCYFTEDIFFTPKASDLGLKVFVDTRIQLRHLGLIPYPASETPLPNDPQVSALARCEKRTHVQPQDHPNR